MKTVIEMGCGVRPRIWNAVRSKLPEGVILPLWALTLKCMLYPLQAFYWHMGRTTGYQWDSDTWKIDGVTYSGRALWLLSEAQGELYRITRTGDTVTLERVQGVEETKEQPAPVAKPHEQEPEYAWPTVADYERDVGFQTNEAFRIAWNMARTTNRMFGHTSSQPAQRTWVGLTDEERLTCTLSAFTADNYRAIEAKLKEKNT